MTIHGRYRSGWTAALGGLVVLAWAALAWLDSSPWAALFHAHGGGAHAHHGAVDLPPGAAAAFFVAGWALMVVAMMLPATFPLVEIFRRLVRRQSNARVLVTALVAGYLVVWTAFGAAVWAGGQLIGHGLETNVARLGLLPSSDVLSGTLFLVAGAFQFSSLKYRCLDRCRAPLGFVTARWRGARDLRTAFRIGAGHGVFCVGCCWALMLLMFAVATASLAWMAVLGVLMGVEKNAAWGARIGKPLGIACLAAGIACLV